MKDNLKSNSKDTPPRFSERRFRLSKDLPSQKFRREEKCERKPSGLPFAFHLPPQRQNCKIMLQNLILQFGKQLDEKAQRDFFDKLHRPMGNPIGRCFCVGCCRVGDSRARRCIDDRYKLPINTYQPIASVAALTAQPLAALPPYGCGVPLAGCERLVRNNSTAGGRWCTTAFP